MKLTSRIIIVLLCFWGMYAKVHAENYTVIVSLDGFRWDYPTIHHTPNLDRIARLGVSTTMRPSYPSSTFPNHYTLITGLVPDHHGIINNSFWDREAGLEYRVNDSITRNNPKYYFGETIWATAQRQQVATASVYWIGSDIPINNNYPLYYKVWADEPRLDFVQRVDTALAWLKKPVNERPRLITLYMDEPDATGHHTGPTSSETAATVAMVDSLIGRLMDGISQLPFAEKVNLIVTADHGMTDVSADRYINITDYVNSEWYTRAVGNNPTSIYTDAENIDSVYIALTNVPHINVYRKSEIPESLNYGTNANVGDLIVVADLGWQFGYKPSRQRGAHGYDPDNKDMHVIFYAYGPDFKKDYRGQPMDNTAIYPLLCRLLHIEPSPNDGDPDQFEELLKK